MPIRSQAVTQYIEDANTQIPIVDDPTPWASIEEATAAIREQFGDYLPTADTQWQDPSSDKTLWDWVTQGYAAPRLERSEDGGFVVKLDDKLKNYSVRDGLQRYGGDAYFDPAGTPTRIHIWGQDHYPGRAGWEAAKFAFRSSCFVWVTFADHLGRGHMGFGNATVLATRKALSPEHPLRCFLKPFTYRTAGINVGASQSLLPGGHRSPHVRISVFEVTAAFNSAFKNYRYEGFDQELRRKGVHPEQLPVGLDYPYAVDGYAYWQHITKFVDNAFENSPALQSVLKARGAETQAWWNYADNELPVDLPELSLDNLKDFLKIVIWTVTGFHSQVGSIASYVRDPRFMSAKLWPNAENADKQSSGALGVLTCITGLEMATLDTSFEHLMPDLGSKNARSARLPRRINRTQGRY